MRVVNHVGLTVTDLGRSVAFYRDVVGLEVQVERFRTGGEWFDKLTENSGAVIHGAMLRRRATSACSSSSTNAAASRKP